MPAAREPAPVPTGARWFVRVFLAAFFICAVFRIEAWPLTGFRLFSSLRTSTGTTWVADTVGADGTETRLWFSDLPRPYQGFHLVTLGFRRLPASQQRAMCTAWLDEARRLRPGVAKLRIYRVEGTTLPRDGNRPGGPESKVLEYACS